MIVYHGSVAPERVLQEGFRLVQPRLGDVGDMGRGIYTTTRYSRAACYGQTVLECRLDVTRYARIPNPYFLHQLGELQPETLDEHVFYALAFRQSERGADMLTINGSKAERFAAAERVRDGMLSAGYTGIVSGYEGECVSYDLNTIQALGYADRNTL